MEEEKQSQEELLKENNQECIVDEKIINEENNDKTNDELESLQNKIEELNKDLILEKEKLLRTVAEFENYKKRLERLKDEALKFANENFARDLLDILDALEAALNVEATDETSQKLKEGVQNTLDLFIKKLEKHNIKEIKQINEFDPNLHEAMQMVESKDHKSAQIIQVWQKGYMINDRVIRHAKVLVAK